LKLTVSESWCEDSSPRYRLAREKRRVGLVANGLGGVVLVSGVGRATEHAEGQLLGVDDLVAQAAGHGAAQVQVDQRITFQAQLAKGKELRAEVVVVLAKTGPLVGGGLVHAVDLAAGVVG
jgi:hypothetical protein